MATKFHEDGPKTHFQWYLHGIVHPIISNTFFDHNFLLSIFQFRGQQLEQVRVDIVLLPYILICLAEQLWVGQAIDACLHTVTYEAFAPCSQFIGLLRSSESTISTHVPRRVHSKSTRMSLHVHEP